MQTVLNLLMAGLAAQVLQASVEVSFVGPDRAHVKYDLTSTIPKTQRLELIWQNPDLQLQVLAQGGTSLKGIRGVTSMLRGTHQFLVKTTYLDARGEEQSSISTGAYCTIDPAKANGRLLLNETIACAGWKMDVSVIVAEGIKLELSDLAAGSVLRITGEGGSLTCRDARLDVLLIDGRGSFMGEGLRLKNALTVPTDFQVDLKKGVLLQRGNSVALSSGASDHPAAPVTFEECEIHGAVSLSGPRQATFTRNVILGPLSLQGTEWDSALSGSVRLNVADNSFLGRDALASSSSAPANRISVGANYYGDVRGPNSWAFAGGRGASVNTNAFDLGEPMRLSGAGQRRFPADTSRFPEVRTVDFRIGQNTLTSASSYVLRRDRESLVTVDVASPWQRLTGVKVYAELDGAHLESLNTPPVLRDWYDFAGSKKASAKAVENGQTTFNIIIPAQTKSTATLKLYLDTTGVNGFDEEGQVQLIHETTLRFQEPPQRVFNIGVVPVRVKVSGYPDTVPDPAITAEVLSSFLPAMLPLQAKNLRVTVDPIAVYDSSSAGWFDSWTTYSLYYTVSSYLEAYLEEYNAIAPPEARYDRLIGVLARGALSADGVNVMTSRSVSLVDEDKPLASLHELGHSFGHYTSTEQYDLKGYPNGYPVLGVTGFIPDASLSVSAFNGYRAVGRVHHYTELTAEEFYDIMGSVEPVWMVGSTFSEMQNSVANLLRQPLTMQSLGRLAAQPQGMAAEGTRRILVRGAYDRSGEPWPFDENVPMYAFIPDTLTAEDVTGTSQIPIPSYNSGKAMGYQFQPLDTNGLPIWGSVGFVRIADITPIGSPVGYWRQTFDVPQATAGFQVVSTDIYGPPLLHVSLRQPPSVQLLKPSAGQTLDSTCSIELSVSGNATTTALTHRLYVSTEGTEDWKPWGGSLRGLRHELATRGLPSGAPFSLKVVSSDGLNRQENLVDGLSVAASGPRVLITSPKSGERGDASSPWSLRAVSFEGSSPVATYQWTSSRDGVLGNQQHLEEVSLSPGEHVLSCTVTDADGRTGSNTQSISVLTAEGQGDAISLPPDLLEVTPAGAPAPAWRLVLDATNRFRVRLVNESSPRQLRLRVFALAPGGTEQLLREQTFAPDYFEPLAFRADYVPNVLGTHQVRLTVETLDAAGSVVKSTERRWEVPASQPAIRIQFEPADAITAGAQWRIDGGPWLAPETEVAGTSLERGNSEHLITFKPLDGWYTPPAFRIRHRPLEAFPLRARYRVDLGILPWFDRHPASATVSVGTNLTLRANAVGTPRPTYQWLKDGRELPGATNNNLSLRNLQASDVGTYVVVAKNTAGTVTSEPAILKLTGGAEAPLFQHWAIAQNLPADARGPNDDPDEDGLPNLVEYALALNPSLPDPEQNLPKATLSGQGPESYLTFTYRQPKTAPGDLTYEVTSSLQLHPWDSTAVIAVGAPVDRVTHVEVTVRSDSSVGRSERGFIQLRLIKR